jgi:hypothetical protein
MSRYVQWFHFLKLSEYELSRVERNRSARAAISDGIQERSGISIDRKDMEQPSAIWVSL